MNHHCAITPTYYQDLLSSCNSAFDQKLVDLKQHPTTLNDNDLKEIFCKIEVLDYSDRDAAINKEKIMKAIFKFPKEFTTLLFSSIVGNNLQIILNNDMEPTEAELMEKRPPFILVPPNNYSTQFKPPNKIYLSKQAWEAPDGALTGIILHEACHAVLISHDRKSGDMYRKDDEDRAMLLGSLLLENETRQYLKYYHECKINGDEQFNRGIEILNKTK